MTKPALRFKQTLKLSPNLASAYDNLGHTYLSLKRYREALDALKGEHAEIDPRPVDANLKLGLEYVYLGNNTEALQQYDVLSNLNPPAARQLRRSEMSRVADMAIEFCGG